MPSAIDRLRSLLVADVMTRRVVQVSACQTKSEVARLFSEHGVSAAPVVDEQGRCIGILSATDCLKQSCNCADNSSVLAGAEHQLVQNGEERPLHIVSTAEDTASACMTDAVQTVDPGATLLCAARIMRAAHIHRLVVLDAQQRPIGIVSTMDVVAALLKAIEEMDLSSKSNSNA